MTVPEVAPAQAPTVREMAVRARRAGRVLGTLPTHQKNAALLAVAASLRHNAAEILAANALDVEAARAGELSGALIDRLTLTPQRLEGVAADVDKVAALPDPVGEILGEVTRPNGLNVSRRRVPLGVLGVIYEARPNVTVDVATLSVKSGNAVILRGGKETARSNAVLVRVIAGALAQHGIPEGAVQVIGDPDRARMLELLKLDDLIDAIIPRGGAGLHRFCVENATVPVIVGGVGVVHLYLDESYVPDQAGVQSACELIVNSKVQRPSACNALDTLLLTPTSARLALPAVAEHLTSAGVELRADPFTFELLQAQGLPAVLAAEDDFGNEFLALTLSLKTVSGLDEALDFIALHGNHTDAILTRDAQQAETFVQNVDSAAVMVNASTRFNDGAQLGLGAEVAVSTQKLHARGPMALVELTTTKWVVRGEGQVRT